MSLHCFLVGEACVKSGESQAHPGLELMTQQLLDLKDSCRKTKALKNFVPGSYIGDLNDLLFNQS